MASLNESFDQLRAMPESTAKQIREKLAAADEFHNLAVAHHDLAAEWALSRMIEGLSRTDLVELERIEKERGPIATAEERLRFLELEVEGLPIPDDLRRLVERWEDEAFSEPDEPKS